jgi:hypothetical protein
MREGYLRLLRRRSRLPERAVAFDAPAIAKIVILSARIELLSALNEGGREALSNRKSRPYDEAERRRRASTAATSELSSGLRNTSEIPASANSSTVASFTEAVASNIGGRGINP